MKKGCFLSVIAVLTIIVGIAMYIFQNHFDTLILSPAKKVIAGFIKNDLNAKLKSVADSKEKAELKKLITDFAENTKAIKKLKEEEINELIKSIESAMTDSIIQKTELEEISQLMESKLK